MLIRKLQVAGLRSFEQAEFTFQPGMNLLVGINGVGKTTVLDALRISLSRVLPEITASRSQKIGFEESDIQIGADTLQVSCDFELDNHEFNLLMVKQRENNVPNSEIGNVRDQVIESPDKEEISLSLSATFLGTKNAKQQPIAIFFSTRRSLLVEQAPSKTSAAGGQATAFAESLLHTREFNLRLVAQWFAAQEELGVEDSTFLRSVQALRTAVNQFLPGFNNLHIVDNGGHASFAINKGSKAVRVAQLSDGERGVLALVLDLARRLSQANPGLENPVRDGVAIVLIDELDLHLHPKWQRSIVENLTRTFPNCQFIATTHSPQIIPAVEPESVQLLKDNKVIHPDRTLGMDSNWILRNIMETDERPEEAEQAIETVVGLIKEGEYELARAKMIDYRQQKLDLPEWSMLEGRIARFETFDEE